MHGKARGQTQVPGGLIAHLCGARRSYCSPLFVPENCLGGQVSASHLFSGVLGLQLLQRILRLPTQVLLLYCKCFIHGASSLAWHAHSSDHSCKLLLQVQTSVLATSHWKHSEPCPNNSLIVTRSNHIKPAGQRQGRYGRPGSGAGWGGAGETKANLSEKQGQVTSSKMELSSHKKNNQDDFIAFVKRKGSRS